MEYITLNNGIKIPQLGLGTYLLNPTMPNRRLPPHSAWGMSSSTLPMHT